MHILFALQYYVMLRHAYFIHVCGSSFASVVTGYVRSRTPYALLTYRTRAHRLCCRFSSLALVLKLPRSAFTLEIPKFRNIGFT